jgi:hypothetical protein
MQQRKRPGGALPRLDKPGLDWGAAVLDIARRQRRRPRAHGAANQPPTLRCPAVAFEVDGPTHYPLADFHRAKSGDDLLRQNARVQKRDLTRMALT